MTTNLAAAVRAVNAEHARCGFPDIPELAEAWVALDRDLPALRAAGEDRAASAAIEAYRHRAMEALSEATT